MQIKTRLVYEDDDLFCNFQQALGNNVTRINVLKASNELVSQIDSGDSVIIVAGENDWDGAIRLLEKMKKERTPVHAIVSSPPALQKTIAQMDAAEAQLNKNGASLSKTAGDQHGGALNFSELIEKRLGGFVKKLRASEGSNLYDLLIQAVEKPLIKLVLKETSGNQVQAAQLLGMHRNTLRKKMKELKISVLKKKSAIVFDPLI